MQKTNLSLMFLGLGLVLAPLALLGQTANPPGQISYQGFLTDANGLPLASNTPRNFLVTFRIYAASSGGTAKWAERQTVTVDRGYFTVMLGAGASTGGSEFWTNNLTSVFSGGDASDRYLGMTAQITGPADTEILPRLRLLASPYALLAANALNASNAVNVTGTGTITLNNLAANSVDASKIVNGSILDAAISPSAAIVDSKLGTIATAGKVADSALSGNVALRAGGNSFTGNQTVKGNVQVGSSGQFYVAAGEENLRMLRGVVRGDASILRGSGFTVTRKDVGWYIVRFNNSFADYATTTVSLESTGGQGWSCRAQVVDVWTVWVLTYNAAGPADMVFNFITVGPR